MEQDVAKGSEAGGGAIEFMFAGTAGVFRDLKIDVKVGLPRG